MASAIDTKPTNNTISTCSGCGKVITDRYLLKALDLLWHEDCLKCGCCDCRLGEVGSTLYTRANLILCKRDYLRLFGTTGNCAACCKVIPAFEMVMRAKNNVYHLECFACHQCHQRFCVGDRFYLHENKILCEYDYEERIIFASMASNPANVSLLQRRVTDCQQGPKNQLTQDPPLWIDPNGTFHPPVETSKAPLNCKAPDNRPKPCGSRIKNYSPSDGSSSGYGSPDSGLLEEG